MSTPCEQLTDDLAAIVDGDRDVIARHADHLASCDACRDARHEATQLANLVAGAGADHVTPATDDVVGRLMTSLGPDVAKEASATLPGIAVSSMTAAAAPAPATPAEVLKPAPAQPALAKPAPAKPAPAKPAERKLVDATPIASARKRPWLAVGA